MADRDALPLPLEVRARLAELELELSEVSVGKYHESQFYPTPNIP